MLDFTPLDGKDAVAVNEMSHLATDIVREHFDPLIGKAQNDYMLARYQAPQAIAEQTAHGSRFLNVNRYNDACRAYEALGFTVARYEVNDIGNGYVMDDAVYEYTL